jgi:hypothetical protein
MTKQEEWEKKFDKLCEEKRVVYTAIMPLINLIREEKLKSYNQGIDDLTELIKKSKEVKEINKQLT